MRKTFWLALLILAGGIAWALSLSGFPGGRVLSFSALLGLALGVVLQRTRFCFLCHARDWHDKGDARGLLAILLALAVGSIGYQVVVGSWLPVPERLPPDLHIGPVSWALALAGIAFGAGMVISGSCISAHLYRLGEGAPVSPFALIGAIVGFGLGFNTWNHFYSATIAEAPILWLPQKLGYAGALLLQLGVLAVLAALLWRKPLPPQALRPPVATLREGIARLFEGRWSYWIGGIAVGLFAVLIIIRTKPLGVTSALGSLARRAGEAQGWVPSRLDGLDTLGGCATLIQDALLTPNGALVLALIAGSFASALAAGQFTPRLPTLRDVACGLFGGVLLGWGSMIGLGCTIGTLLSGISAGAVSGWVFALSVFIALSLGFKLQAYLRRS
ncbi:MAG: YeeE/YedE family protein [Rhodocyclaceae bacterium]|nr:YeeE/YedE family protein [Rhodocyclaceae bacterium]